MLLLLGDKQQSMNGEMLQNIFLQRLSTRAKVILATSVSEPLNTITRMADQLIDVSSPCILQIRQDPRSVNSVFAHPPYDDRSIDGAAEEKSCPYSES